MNLHRVIAARTDGLGARLSAIFNALIISDIVGCDFAFTWPHSYVKNDEFHTVPEVQEIFSPHFLQSHYFAPQTQNEEDLPTLAFPKGSLAETRRLLISLLSRSEYNVSWTPFMRQLDALSSEDRKQLTSRAVERLGFSTRIEAIRRRIQEQTLPDHAKALHLRSGDIIYGRFADSPGWTTKVIPAPFAAVFLRHDNDPSSFVIFGQEVEVADALSKEYGAVSARSLCNSSKASPLEVVFEEIFLLARCSQIYSGSSAFAVFAGMLGECNFPKWRRHLEDAQWINLFAAELERNYAAYSSQQVAFSYFCLYELSQKRGSHSDLLSLIGKALHFFPTNRLYALLYCLNSFDRCLWDVGEAALDTLGVRFGQSKDELLSSREMRRVLRSRPGGSNPYARHINGLEQANRAGSPSAKALLRDISDM